MADEGSVCSHIGGNPVTFARRGIAMFLVLRYSDRDGRRGSSQLDSCLCLMTRMSRRRIDCCISISSLRNLRIPKLVSACKYSCGFPLELPEDMFDLLSLDILVCGPPHMRWDLNRCLYLATMARVFKSSTSP